MALKEGSYESVIIQKNLNPLQCLKRFELGDVGVSVKHGKTGVEVVEVKENKPFFLAGLQKGDLIQSVGEDKTNTSEEFRRQVRRRSVDDKVTDLNIRRGDRDIQLLVHLLY